MRAETYRWTPEEHAARISLPQTEGPLSGTADTFSCDTDSILAGCVLNTTCSLPYCCFGKPSFRMETGRSSPRECHPVVDLVREREREGTQPDWLYRRRDLSKCLLWNISIIPVVFGSEQHCVSIYSNASFLLLMQLLHSVWVPERCSCQWTGAEKACNCSSELLFLQRRRCEKGKWQQMCTAVCRDIWWREKSNLSVYTGDAF